MDWPHAEETRWTFSQEGTGVEPTGEANERKTPAHHTRMAKLERKHLTWNEAKGTAQNGVRWHVLVEDLCSTWNERGFSEVTCTVPVVTTYLLLN